MTIKSVLLSITSVNNTTWFPTFVQHALLAYGTVLTGATFLGHPWWWAGSVIVASLPKELWFDRVYENPPEPASRGLLTVGYYAIGAVGAAIVAGLS